MKEYLTKTDEWSWEEIDLLEQALGFHGRLFYSVAQQDKKKNSFISTEDLMKILETNLLHPYVHKTFNHHDTTYNLKVLSKAIELIGQRYINFSTLRLARVSFQSYEHADCAGVEDKLALRAMRLCGKTIAPLKLKQTFRHMKKLVIDRMMLYEYLELLSVADDISDVIAEVPEKKVVDPNVDSRRLYDLCDFEAELSTLDDRCHKYLNRKYQDFLNIIPMKNPGLSNTSRQSENWSTKQWIKPPYANSTVRKNMSEKNKVQSKLIGKFVHPSNIAVKQCGCGYTCMCTSSIDITEKKQIPVSDSNEKKEFKEHTSQTIVNHLPPVVADQDVQETVQRIQNIQWEMATRNESTKRRLDSLFKNVTSTD